MLSREIVVGDLVISGRFEDPIAVVWGVGALTPKELPEAKTAVFHMACEYPLSALFVDIRRIDWQVTADQLHDCAVAFAPRIGVLQEMPAAYLCTAAQLPMMTRYVHLMAREGVGRSAFTDASTARVWALRQAQVFATWKLARTASLSRATPGIPVS